MVVTIFSRRRGFPPTGVVPSSARLDQSILQRARNRRTYSYVECHRPSRIDVLQSLEARVDVSGFLLSEVGKNISCLLPSMYITTGDHETKISSWIALRSGEGGNQK